MYYNKLYSSTSPCPVTINFVQWTLTNFYPLMHYRIFHGFNQVPRIIKRENYKKKQQQGQFLSRRPIVLAKLMYEQFISHIDKLHRDPTEQGAYQSFLSYFLV